MTIRHQPKEPAVISAPKQSWHRNSPTSLVRSPLRFTSEEDRQYYRKGVRTLALVYAGLLVLVIAITALRVDWRNQDVAAKATASAVATANPAHPLSAGLARASTQR